MKYVKLNDLPQEEYHNAYVRFRTEFNQFIQNHKYASDLELNSIPGNALVRDSTCLFEFFAYEGVSFPIDSSTFQLDPAPFEEMKNSIITKSKPTHSKFFSKKTSAKDLSVLKNFQLEVIESVVVWGFTKNTLDLCVSVIKSLENIEAKTQNTKVNFKENKEASEITKNGGVCIVVFDYKFEGEVTKKCCCGISIALEEIVDVKAWKFQTLGDLKAEFRKNEIEN